MAETRRNTLPFRGHKTLRDIKLSSYKAIKLFLYLPYLYKSPLNLITSLSFATRSYLDLPIKEDPKARNDLLSILTIHLIDFDPGSSISDDQCYAFNYFSIDAFR